MFLYVPYREWRDGSSSRSLDIFHFKAEYLRDYKIYI